MTSSPARLQPRLRDRFGRVLLRLALQRLGEGEICVRDGGRVLHGGRATPGFDVSAGIEVRSPRFYGALLAGSVGAGRSYLEGEWDAEDLTALVRVCVRNLGGLDRLRRRTRPITRPVLAARGWLRRNTRARSRERIAAHYDIGDDFFELFLDPTMTYSCGVFERPDATLAEAQLAKVERICRKLDLGPGDHLLEIGTGWGYLAVHAASRFGCRVTTTTISPSQHRRALARVREAGLEDRVTVLLTDYRDLEGRFTKLVSVEMIEAVGSEYFDAFFASCARLLQADGLMCLQAITIADHLYEDSRLREDYINRFIFPGGCLPSRAAIAGSLARATDMRIVHLEDIGPHYARTLGLWRANLQANLDRIRAAGYEDPRFLRMWDLYLAFCEGAFAERRIGDVQILMARPGFRREPLHPLPAAATRPASPPRPRRPEPRGAPRAGSAGAGRPVRAARRGR